MKSTAISQVFGRWMPRLAGSLWSGGGHVARHGLRALLYGLIGGVLMLVVMVVLHLNGRPELSPWHTEELEEEFTKGMDLADFQEYLRLEERLFDELDRKVYGPVEEGGLVTGVYHRFRSGSPSDPRGSERNWNRSFELSRPDPTVGVLLLHGMSDSPYSLRALGERLHREGAHVVGLRLPGHGTAPSGLVHVEWEDMHGAVVLAMRHLASVTEGRPIHIIGYSNGGALAVHYTIAALDSQADEALPVPGGIVLVSPAIGVSPMASLAVWQSRLGHWLGLEKLEWNSIHPEYDPYKYGSFAVNAGHQVYRLTTEIQSRLARLQGADRLKEMPGILAFQSAIDATVSTTALVKGLFARLPASGHELVLFDINRSEQIEGLLMNDPTVALHGLLESPQIPFAVTLLTNRDAATSEIMIETAGASRTPEAIRRTPIPLSWPRGVYSLSHVSLPFASDDPVYGISDQPAGRLKLGNIALRGERGLLQVSAEEQLRLRWNPFYSYLEERVLSFTLPSPER